MDDGAIIELRARLIFLFRVLQVNTVFAMDPYNHYDENPDHIVVGKAVEAACWMSGGRDYPEHFKAGLKPAHIREKYYYRALAPGPQPGEPHRGCELVYRQQSAGERGQPGQGSGRKRGSPPAGVFAVARQEACPCWAMTMRPPTSSTSSNS